MSAFAPDHLLPHGTVVQHTYTVQSVLGAGAFSVVYEVRHRFLGPQAMKVFRVGAGAPSVDDILNEARILADLVDPHVVRVFEANTVTLADKERPYMTMELVRGGSLEGFLERKIRLNPLSSLKTARQICSGLAAAHRLQPPVVHRDVKPQNVLIYAVSIHGTPQVKVGDFGLARHVAPESRMATAAGSLHYLAPEAVWGIHSLAGDVYAAGVVLYRMLTGVFPFPVFETAESLESLRARREAPPPPSRLRLGLPAQIDGVVARALAPDPAARYSDAIMFGAQLEHVIEEFTH